jgi:hypothetical protein
MRTKSAKKNKINVITLGCSKNTYDSEVLMGQLAANKIDVEHESEKKDANIIVINTCGFIDNAKEVSINTILQQAQRKEAGMIDKLYVTGCLSERYKPDLERHPVTYNLSIIPASLRCACCKIVLMDTSFALSIKPQVFITIIFASFFSDSCSTSILLAANCPINTSES